jgi:hypothetical protein
MRRRFTAREARDREVEASPKEVHRARFADERRAEGLAEAIRLQERAPEPLRRLGVERCVRRILIERRRVGELVRFGVDAHIDVEHMELPHQPAIELGDAHRLEVDPRLLAVAAIDAQRLLDEIEVDAERSTVAVRHHRRRQAARCDVERNVPPVVEHRLLPQANLADDLRPTVQRLGRLLPLLIDQVRPTLHPRGFDAAPSPTTQFSRVTYAVRHAGISPPASSTTRHNARETSESAVSTAIYAGT